MVHVVLLLHEVQFGFHKTVIFVTNSSTPLWLSSYFLANVIQGLAKVPTTHPKCPNCTQIRKGYHLSRLRFTRLCDCLRQVHKHYFRCSLARR